MPKKTISASGDPLHVEVIRKFPFQVLKTVRVKIPGDTWKNEIDLNTDQVAYLYAALRAILVKDQTDGSKQAAKPRPTRPEPNPPQSLPKSL